MVLLKNKQKYHFQLLLMLLFTLSVILSCESNGGTTPGPGPGPTTPQVEKIDSSSGAIIGISDTVFILSNNDWGYSCTSVGCDQAIILYKDGSYGWQWDRDSTGDNDPNYPEVLCGTKPWGSKTQATIFPIQIKDLNSCNAGIDIDLKVSGNNWNLAFEFWLTSEEPGLADVSGSITDEVMIWLRWGVAHDVITIEEEDAVVDGGRTYDYAQYYPAHGSGWDYHQFRISEEETFPSTIDIKLFIDYLQDRYGLSDSLWMTGMELGNEYWDHTEGKCTINNLSYLVNGETVGSGSD